MKKNKKTKSSLNCSLLNMVDDPDYSKLEEASTIIRNGGLVIFPTETVYGLGANGLDEEAVKKIYIAKGRKADNPLILHICDIEMLGKISSNISDLEFKLMNAFWPGPFTIILNKASIVPSIVTGGLETVAVRMPNNDIARNLIKFSEVPIAAPSANISGRPSGTNINDIYKELSYDVDYIIDGGSSQIGLESTVVRVIDGIPHILRPGGITADQIEEVAGNVIIDQHILGKLDSNQKVLSPGMKYKHYSPNTKCVLVYNNNIEKTRKKMINLANECLKNSHKPLIMCSDDNLDFFKNEFKGVVNFISMGNSLNDISKNLFSNLRKVDSYNIDLVIIQGVESNGLGLAIMNRLLRACEYNLYD